MAFRLMPDPQLYDQAVRSGGVAIWYSVDAARGGSVLASDLRPTGGAITDTITPGVRRLLNLELAPEQDLYDLLAPAGTTLTVTGHVRLTDRSMVDVPMGVFDVDVQRMSVGGGALRLTAPDKWVRVQRAKFVRPQFAVPGVEVITQIGALVRGGLGESEPINVVAAPRGAMVAMAFERDRDKAILDIAGWTSLWVRFDRNGTLTIVEAPTEGQSASWLIDASPSGVLVSLDRERSRTSSANVVTVFSTAADGELFPPQTVWDDDPDSPTYAGPDPLNSPELAGPFGVVPAHIDTPLALSAAEARAVALGELAKVTGLLSQVSLSSTLNPAIDAGDVIDVLPPGRSRSVVTGYVGGGGDGFGTQPFGTSPFGTGSGDDTRVPVVQQVSEGAVIERHLVETVTHPLVVGDGALQQIEGRLLRAAAFT